MKTVGLYLAHAIHDDRVRAAERVRARNKLRVAAAARRKAERERAAAQAVAAARPAHARTVDRDVLIDLTAEESRVKEATRVAARVS